MNLLRTALIRPAGARSAMLLRNSVIEFCQFMRANFPAVTLHGDRDRERDHSADLRTEQMVFCPAAPRD
jgi:hypothetical protein